jgi:hypothetical protein
MENSRIIYSLEDIWPRTRFQWANIYNVWCIGLKVLCMLDTSFLLKTLCVGQYVGQYIGEHIGQRKGSMSYLLSIIYGLVAKTQAFPCVYTQLPDDSAITDR